MLCLILLHERLLTQSQQNHVHLISAHQFPLTPRMNYEDAFRLLINAPTIVKQTAPMAWTYVQGPRDGTVWLEWLSPRQSNERRFSSDGYIWGDSETTARAECGGYTIEWMMHTVGYNPKLDHTASHARTRYHLIGKNSSLNAAPPDPKLWIVHYHQTQHGNMLPVQQVPTSPHARQTMHERRWLEAQGTLTRVPFMLHDREHWPTIGIPDGTHVPSLQRPGGMYANPMLQQQQQMMSQRFPQQHYPSAQGPPLKRARVSGGNSAPSSREGYHEIIEDEENVDYGDYFDHLTLREISMARYSQHHQWMEEVFSSPYASAHIVPPDLGLGLMGELKGLTEGILNPPSLKEIGLETKDPARAKEAQPFTNLKKEQIDEFNRRVEKHLAEGEAEIERMKKEHADKMNEWKKSKTLADAERRLRHVTWDGHASAVPVFRFDAASANEKGAEPVPGETLEGVVKNVETALGVKIAPRKDVTIVQKGGLEREEEQRQVDITRDTQVGVDAQKSTVQSNGLANGAGTSIAQSRMALDRSLDVSAASSGSQMSPQATPSNVPQAPLQTAQAGVPSTLNALVQEQQSGEVVGEHHGLDEMEGMPEGDASLMDMDVDTGDIDFVDYQAQDMADETADVGQASLLDANQGLATDHSAGMRTAQSAIHDIAAAQPSLTTAVEASTAPPPHDDTNTGNLPVMPTADVPAQQASNDTSALEDSDLFGESTFDDLTNMGDTNNAEDALLDFDAGAGGDDAAFDDTMQGMSEAGPEGQSDQQRSAMS